MVELRWLEREAPNTEYVVNGNRVARIERVLQYRESYPGETVRDVERSWRDVPVVREGE